MGLGARLAGAVFKEPPAALGLAVGGPGEAEAFLRGIDDAFDGFFGRIGDDEQVEVFGVDAAIGQHAFADEVEHGFPVALPHEDDGKVLDLAGLDEGESFEEFVEGAEATGADDEGVGVLDEHDLADEEVAELDELVDEGVGLLLVGEGDVAADGRSASVACAAVGGFHDSRPAAGHDGEPEFADASGDIASDVVVVMIFGESCGAEDGDAGADEVQCTKAFDELEKDAEGGGEFEASGVRTLEELTFFDVARGLAPSAGALVERGGQVDGRAFVEDWAGGRVQIRGGA